MFTSEIISFDSNQFLVDSPKLSTKHLGGLQRGKSLGSAGNSPARTRKPFSVRKTVGNNSKAHDIVVVKPGKDPESQDKDAHLQKLQNIPMFLPIMRGTLNLPGMRDPEVLEKLDPQDFLAFCKRLQSYMGQCADHVATNQNQITSRVREVNDRDCYF